MALVVFLTGTPGVGKSTVVRLVAQSLKLEGTKVGGMTTGDLRSGSTRIGFEIRDLSTDEAGVLAHVNRATGPRIGKYRVNDEDLDNIGAGAILSGIKDADLIVIDEVGPMELTSWRFEEAVRAALACGKPILGTVHRNAQDPLVSAIKSTPEIAVIEVTYANRDDLPRTLAERFKAGRR